MKKTWFTGLASLVLASTSSMALGQGSWDQPSLVSGPTTVSQTNYFNPSANNEFTPRRYQDGPAPQVPQVPVPPVQGYAPQAPAYPAAPQQPVYGSAPHAPGYANGPQAPAYTYNHVPDAPSFSVLPETNAATYYGNSGNGDAGVGACDQNGPRYFQQRSIAPAYGNATVAEANCNVGGKCRNIVVGVGGLVFFRDYEDDVGLSGNGAGQYLFSTDASFDAMGGVEFFVQSRNSEGRGLEARYWGLFPNCVGSNLAAPWTALGGLSQVYHGASGSTVQDVFNRADSHEVCRENRIHNAEFSRLINAGSFTGLGCRAVNVEVLHGVRWFEFDEYFEYNALSTGTPAFLSYNLETRNTLIGYQIGGRATRCLCDRVQLITGVRFGLYNNNIRHRQQMIDENGYISYINSGPSSGRPYDYDSSKNDLSTLGELEVGFGYLLTSSCRFTLGYRVIGATGLALAPDQIPYNFTDANELRRIDSNGSLLLHGLFGGLNFCF